jgi:hypothetical protein
VSAPGRWTRRRKLLASCGLLLGLLLIAGLASSYWLYRHWRLHEPDPRPLGHFVNDETDAFIGVNIARDDGACRVLASSLLESAGLRLPAGQLPAWLVGRTKPDDTLLDLPGMLPAQMAIYYRYQKPRNRDDVFGVASFAGLPLMLRAAGALGFRSWASQLAQANSNALSTCDGAPVLRLKQPTSDVPELDIALLNKTAFGSLDLAEIERAIRLFRAEPASGPAGGLATICRELDLSSDLVAAVRNREKVVRRLLRMTEDTPPDELPPDEFMLVNYGIDPDAMLGVGLQLNLETADRAACRVFILCPDAATASTFAGLVSNFLPHIGKPYFACKVTGTRVNGPMVQVDFTTDGLLRLPEAISAGMSTYCCPGELLPGK